MVYESVHSFIEFPRENKLQVKPRPSLSVSSPVCLPVFASESPEMRQPNAILGRSIVFMSNVNQ